MFIDKISIGKNPPEEVNVIIEIPRDTIGVKYEIDKESGAVFVDRYMLTNFGYPLDYGFIPHTLSNDGDPTDVLVISDHAVVPGAVIRCRPIGVLMMEDESGFDEKILAVPVTKLDPSKENIQSLNDVSSFIKDKITHFFENYKKLEKNKWVKVTSWEDVDKAKELIKEAIERAAK
ncbi:MAG: inorganic pyrophosphatase [Rickettsiaceae bacterium]|jgi:inorganic pyrophosphatase|nr:inorganic pyrophosphatase [Rickettsiaceae bacterium]